jgi:hypothetical protein
MVDLVDSLRAKNTYFWVGIFLVVEWKFVWFQPSGLINPIPNTQF